MAAYPPPIAIITAFDGDRCSIFGRGYGRQVLLGADGSADSTGSPQASSPHGDRKDAIKQNTARLTSPKSRGPAEAQADGVRMRQHRLGEQIEADRYAKAAEGIAGNTKSMGLWFARIKPPEPSSVRSPRPGARREALGRAGRQGEREYRSYVDRG